MPEGSDSSSAGPCHMLQGESPETVAHYQSELERLKRIYATGEQQRLEATVDLALSEQMLKVLRAQDEESDRYFGADSIQRDAEAIRLKIADLDAETESIK